MPSLRRLGRPRGWWPAPALLLLLNAAIITVAFVFRQTVVPGWKKGPLIDPAAPYSPENAQLLFSVGLCLALDVYLLLLAAWRRRHAPRWWVPWAALLLSTVVAEAGLRAWLAVDMLTYFRPHPILHWVVRPDLRDFDNLTGGGRITTNHDGLRMPGPDAVRERGPTPPDAFRILVLGDSSNFGHGVEGDEMWSAVLERILDPLTPRRVQVINGACPGWTTYQAVEWMRLVGEGYDPDIVIAGFNNDPGPDYLHDADRVLPPGLRRDLSALAWNSELYLLSREVLLSLIRRLSPAARAVYTERHAGADPKYGRLSPEEAAALVPRVPLDDFLDNVATLDRMGAERGFAFAWIDMPINRNEPELIERYVDWRYREAVAELAQREGFPLIGVDDRQVRQRARDLHVEGHVFHPNAEGHRRLAQQVGDVLVSSGLLPGEGGPVHGHVHVDGPEPVAREPVLRFGWSSRTPVHAHVGLVLEAMPELARARGIELESHDYHSGKEQGDDVASGALDAFFTTGVPALRMLDGRPDARLIGTPGALGRIGVVARADAVRRLEDLRGGRVGLAAGSTPAMEWARWGEGLAATVVPMATEDLEAALDEGEVDAIVGWDPWVELWLQRPGRALVVEAPFESLLAVGIPWASPIPAEPGAPRAARLLALVEYALAVAAADRPRWDAAVAARSGWPVEVVTAVADRNPILAGRARHLDIGPTLRARLDRTAAWLARPDLGPDALLGLELLTGQHLRLRPHPIPPRRPARPPTGAPAVPPAPPSVQPAPAGAPAQPRSGSP